MSTPIEITAQPTPNPDTLRYSWGRLIAEGGPYEFCDEVAARPASPLAGRLFRLNGVMGVFIGQDFVTVTRHPGVGWERLSKEVRIALQAHVDSGEIAVDPQQVAARPAESADPHEIETKIRAILDRDIRPAVAMDGGDIQFVGYNAGVVMLQLRGSCHGCPSSMATLKMGVENRLRQEIPEIIEVMAMM